MSEQDNTPPTYDNKWLIPYLKIIADTLDDSIDKAEFESKALQYHQEHVPDEEYIGGSKLRQTMYIAKLAKTVNKTEIALTDAGREFIANGE